MKRGEASNYSSKENRNSITPPNANQRSFSYDQKSDNNKSLINQKKEVTKIIITPQIQNVFNHNINNIYIQNSHGNNDVANNSNNNVNFGSGDKVKNTIGGDKSNNTGSFNNLNNNAVNYNSYDNRNNINVNLGYNSNQGYIPLNRPNSVTKKDPNFSLNSISQHQQCFDNSRSQIISSNNNKDMGGYNINNDKLVNRSLETQKTMQNNYLNNQNILE